MGRYEAIETPNRSARGSEFRSDKGVGPISGFVERQYGHLCEHAFDGVRHPSRATTRDAKPEFGRDDDARTDIGILEQCDALCGETDRISHEIGNDIRVQEVADQRSTGLAGDLSSKSKSSSMGSSVAR